MLSKLNGLQILVVCCCIQIAHAGPLFAFIPAMIGWVVETAVPFVVVQGAAMAAEGAVVAWAIDNYPPPDTPQYNKDDQIKSQQAAASSAWTSVVSVSYTSMLHKLEKSAISVLKQSENPGASHAYSNDPKYDVFTFAAPGTTGNKVPRAYPIQTGALIPTTAPSLEAREITMDEQGRPVAPPGVPQFELDRCLDDLVATMKTPTPVHFRNPANPGEPGTLQIDNLPPTCMTLNGILQSGSAVLVMGSASLKWTNVSNEQARQISDALIQGAAKMSSAIAAAQAPRSSSAH